MSEHTKRNGIAWLESQPRATQVAIIRDILELGRIVATHVMDQEVTELAGERYSRDKPHGGRYSRWGTKTGSIQAGA